MCIIVLFIINENMKKEFIKIGNKRRKISTISAYYKCFNENTQIHFLRIELGPKRDKSEDFIVSEKEIDEVINLLDKYLLLS